MMLIILALLLAVNAAFGIYQGHWYSWFTAGFMADALLVEIYRRFQER